MTDLEKLMLLLPIMFMLHEYEEVVMFKQWIFQNRENLKRHFPQHRLLPLVQLTNLFCFPLFLSLAYGKVHINGGLLY